MTAVETGPDPRPDLAPAGSGPPTGPVARYLDRSIAPAAAGIDGVRLHSRGLVRLGHRWWPYRAVESVRPQHGYTRAMTIAGMLHVTDSFVLGRARHHLALGRWTLGRDLRGHDLALGDAARCALTAMWVPSAVAPEAGGHWWADDAHRVSVAFEVGDVPVAAHLSLHPGGLPHRITVTRWGDPDRSGLPRFLPYGVDVWEHRTYGGLTVPATGVAGWHIGTPRWPSGAVLRFQLTDIEPLPPADPGSADADPAADDDEEIPR